MVRRRVAIAAVVSAVLFGVLTYLVMTQPQARWLAGNWPGQGAAGALFRAAKDHAALAQVATGLGLLGGDVVATILVAGAAIVLLATRHRALAAYLVLSAVGSVLLVGVMKDLVARERPPTLGVLADVDSFAYPSGHASAGIAVFGAIGVVIIVLAHGSTGRVLGAAMIALGILIGLSRLALGVHWASDVVGGWLLGLAITCTVGWGVLAASSRRRGVS